MHKKLKITVVLAGIGFMALSFTGCALLPYSSNYSCPEAKSDMGNCSSLTANYKASLHPALYAKLENQKKAVKVNCPVSLKHTAACSEYAPPAVIKNSKNAGILQKQAGFIPMREALYKYMLQAQTPPLRIPSVVKKALILPYSDKNVFHGFTEIYFITRKGRWLMGNYLNKKYKSIDNVNYSVLKS